MFKRKKSSESEVEEEPILDNDEISQLLATNKTLNDDLDVAKATIQTLEALLQNLAISLEDKN